MYRRQFILGTGAVLAAAAMPAAKAVSAPAQCIGLRWQTWPWDSDRPTTEYASGTWFLRNGETESFTSLLNRWMQRHSFNAFGPVFVRPIKDMQQK